MNKETIKKLILLHQEGDVQLVERDMRIHFAGRINVIIGPRRAGKTFFIYQNISRLKNEVDGVGGVSGVDELEGVGGVDERGEEGERKDRIIYINFEDERLLPIKKEDLNLILESYYELYPENIDKKLYVFFDEIQEVPFWNLAVRRIYDQGNVEICITGSSSKLLSREIATQLRGRTLTYFIFPYSFKEFLSAKGVVLERHFEFKPLRYEIKKLLREYIKFGGFPEIADRDELLKTKILQEYFEMTFYKDLVERYRIRNFGMVKEMMLYLVNNFSSYFSTNKYYNMLKSQGKKVSKNTIFTYISCMADINFIFLVPKYGKLKEQFANQRKVYVIDTGLINAIAFKVSSDAGRLYENLVCVELKRRGKDLYYWKNRHECDFLVRAGGEVREAIQVCYDLTEENRDREISGVTEPMEEFGLDVGLVITADFEGEEEIGGRKIIYKPLWRWLLE